MPTRWKRIPVTQDPELSEALARVAARYPDLAPARLVHDLAIKGAEAVTREGAEETEALEQLVALSTRHGSLIDWNVLAEIDELGWAE
jgi:hypothetical protein